MLHIDFLYIPMEIQATVMHWMEELMKYQMSFSLFFPESLL